MNATTIVVGVSGTEGAHRAIDWAVHYAARSGSEVRLEHAVDSSWGAAATEYADLAMLDAEGQLREQVEHARTIDPTVLVRSGLRVGEPSRELAAATEDASMLVLGSHRANAGAQHSTSRRAARLAAAVSCPVVVVPSDDTGEGRGIVVGVDGSADSIAAVRFAAREADFYGEPLTVIYSWYAPQPWSGSTASSVWPTEPKDEDRMVLSEAIAGISEDYPGLTVRPELVVADPVLALDRAARSARMLVVGSRGRHGLTKLLLGSVSEQLVWMLPCAVAVIRPVD